jgi:predicted DNA-binding transcriptional regulator YafY
MSTCDPLAAERQAIVQKSIEDYVEFCKASAGIMPASWFSSFFENTQLLLDTERESEDGNYGEVTLTIEPNRELRGKILVYGQYLEVVKPISLREQIKDILKRQMKYYFDKK